MRVALLTLIAAGLVLGGAVGATSAGPAPVLDGTDAGAVVLDVPGHATLATGAANAEPAAGCRVTARAKNSSGAPIAISRDSEVRSTTLLNVVGPWDKLEKSVWIEPGKSGSWVYDLTFDCQRHRQYRFLVKQGNSTRSVITGEALYYYPKQGGIADGAFTSATTLDLGDLKRFF